MLALVLSTLIAAGGPPAYFAACPAQQFRVLGTSTPIVGDNIHPTNRQAKFLLDVGSDGAIRRAALTESSGDATFDQAALEAAQRFRFSAPSQGCISTSFVVPESFNVPLITLARPQPSGPPVLASAAPENALAICPAPFVELAGLDAPDTRQAPGTVDVDVAVDAGARVTGVKLAKSSGNPKTDATGTALAHDAQYAFTLPAGCRPKPTTYRLELTFK